MKKPPLVVICLAIGAFLLPIIGGGLSLDSLPIMPDDNLISAVIGGQKAPLFAHLFASLFFVVPLLNAIFRRKIMHVPSLVISIPLAVFAGALGISIVFSDFKHLSAVALVDWSLMIGAYYAVTTSSGRKSSSWVLLGLVLGISVCAVIGIKEFSDIKATDPFYRIFALQLNPNQAGALFASGICLSIPLLLQVERLQKLLVGIAIAFQAFALFLTQSKGSILCLVIGLVVLAAVSLGLKLEKGQFGKVFVAAVVPLALGTLMAFGAQKAAVPENKAAGTVVRLTNSSEVSTQSVGFRRLLWQSATDLAKERPFGWGLGTFWYESTRPGRVTQTVLAHETYLQLLAEASFLAPLGLFGFFVAVFGKSLKGSRNLPQDTKLNLIGAVSGLAVAISHNAIDSDMYVFGLGAMVFVLCGILTSSSVDSQSPEVVFVIPRASIVATAAIVLPLALSLSFAEIFRAQSRGFEAMRDGEQSAQKANLAASISFADGRAYYQKFRSDRSLESIQRATGYHPSPKFFRAQADSLFAYGRFEDGIRSLNSALDRDPNNASALLQYVKAANTAGQTELAIEKARALIKTEETTYFTVRSQPEFIPTQTYEVRTILAKLVTGEEERTRLRSEALKGYIQYRNVTIPVLKRALQVSKDIDLAGENSTSAVAKLNLGLELIEALRGKPGVQLDLDAEKTLFDAALADLFK